MASTVTMGDQVSVLLVPRVPSAEDFARKHKHGSAARRLAVDTTTGILYLWTQDDEIIPITTAGGQGGTPSLTVVSETAFGQSSDAGLALTFARGDHTHGTPTNPIPAHEGAADPHPGYALDSELAAHVAAADPHPVYALDADLTAHTGAADPHPTYALDADLSAHAAAADPHTVYQLASQRNAANGYAGLDASSKLTGSQQVYGSAANTACQGNDSRLSDARTPTAHASSHVTGGSDVVPAFTSTAAGLAPASGGGTSNFLRADGTWAAPAGGASPAGVLSDLQMSVLQSDGTLNAAAGVQTWAGTNKTGQDVFTVAANSTYRVRGRLILNTGATSHTTALAWALSGATVADFQYLVNLWSAALNAISTAQSSTHVSGVASKVLNATSTAVYTLIEFEGILVVTNGGTVTPQVNFSANPTGTNLMKRGSWISFERLGADTFTAAGGWG